MNSARSPTAPRPVQRVVLTSHVTLASSLPSTVLQMKIKSSSQI